MFLDRDGNGRRDPGEPGLAGVSVSNGRQVVRTAAGGHYRLPVDADDVIFVIQPRGHRVPVDANGVPRFYYVHKPAGSPGQLRFRGVAPTGPLPERIDFGLMPGDASEHFSVLLLGDTQVRDVREIGYLARDVVAPLVGTDAAFGIALGDLAFDDLSVLEPLSRVLGQLAIPWWPVIGNHDVNLRAVDDADSDETWTRLFGPTHYAFQRGRVHFVVLDNDVYEGWDAAADAPGRYRPALGEEELLFVEQYLAHVPADDLVVIATHVPLAWPEGSRSEGADRLLALLSGRPHTLSISAHAHRQYQLFLGAGDGFAGPGTHHHLNVGASSGSWWLGALDEDGIPHATMRDGAPNGYWIAHFEGTAYRLEFRAARRPAQHQINVIAPFRISTRRSSATRVLANVFAGSERTRVELRLDTGAWHAMRPVLERDPLFERVFQQERETPPADRPPLRAPGPSAHLWAATLPADLAVGSHLLTVRATDPYLGTLQGHHILDVVP